MLSDEKLKAKQAAQLGDDGDYESSIAAYQELLELDLALLDRCKSLANLAQVHEKKGDLEVALKTALEALNTANEHRLYSTMEGAHLRGYLKGMIRRLSRGQSDSGQIVLAPDLEMNFSSLKRLQAHFSVATLGAALSATLASEVGLPDFKLVEPNTQLTLISSTGLLIGWFVTDSIVEKVSLILHEISNRPIIESAKTAVNLLSVVAVAYLCLIPGVWAGLKNEIVLFALLGLGALFLFIPKRDKGLASTGEPESRKASLSSLLLLGIGLAFVNSIILGFVGAPHRLLETDQSFATLSRLVFPHSLKGSLWAASVIGTLWLVNTARISEVSSEADDSSQPGCSLAAVYFCGIVLFSFYVADVFQHL